MQHQPVRNAAVDRMARVERSERILKTICALRWKARGGFRPGESENPATSTLPEKCGERPASTRSRVDLPDPDPPTRPKKAPASTASVAPVTA